MVETTLTVFGMLPAIVFVASAVLRDHDTATAELFFVKPISRWQYLWGRFGAACLLSALLGLAGILGSLTGTLMPWVDQERIAAFSVEPFVFCYFAIVLPNMLILCALFFSVACLSRSLAAAVGLALVLLVSDVALAGYALDSDRPGLLVLADHSATLLVSAASRNLTVPELNTLLPQTLLVANRLLWLAFATVVLLVSFKRFRLEVAEGRAARRLRNKDIAAAAAPAPLPSTVELTVVPGDSVAAQLFSQLRMDFTGVMRSPLFVLILLLGIVSAVNDYGTHVSPIMSSPLYPVTSSMLDFFRHGVFGLVLIIIIYYSGMVVHREREAGIAQMVDAAPMPDWILPVSKTLALCAVVTVLLFVMLLTSIGLQAVNGQIEFRAPRLSARGVPLQRLLLLDAVCPGSAGADRRIEQVAGPAAGTRNQHRLAEHRCVRLRARAVWLRHSAGRLFGHERLRPRGRAGACVDWLLGLLLCPADPARPPPVSARCVRLVCGAGA